MIITRSPLRITLGGGGTDLPSYYRDHGGFLIAAAIDRYVYVTVMRPFIEGIFLKYSKLEHVKAADQVQHPIIREAIKMAGFRTPQVEITTLADIPAGTGLGSSGSFSTALLKALYAHRRRLLHPGELAEMACDIEINRLKEPIGKQDQYIAAYGGITCFTFNEGDTVEARPLNLAMETMFDLEDNLLLFFTGFSRSTGSILKDQNDRTLDSDTAMLANLDYVKELGLQSRAALEQGKTALFGEMMHEHWEHKKRRSAGMSNPQIDEWYELGRCNGAVGGKLVGAGGGGFLLFYAEDHRRLRTAMARAGLEEVRFRFDFEGTKGTVRMTMPVAILAGGLATRLGPIAERLPKSIVEVAGRPFAEHQIELLRQHGVRDIVFLVGHLGELVRDALGDGSRWDVRLRYVFDGPVRRGTGGAIRQALPALDDPFFVLYGDSYLECDYEAVEQAFLRSGRAGLMTVCRNEDRWDLSNVRFEGGRILGYDKSRRVPDMRHIDYGLGAFRHTAFSGDWPDVFDLADVYQRLLERADLAGFDVPSRFFEIGSVTGLEDTRTHLERKGSTIR